MMALGVILFFAGPGLFVYGLVTLLPFERFKLKRQNAKDFLIIGVVTFFVSVIIISKYNDQKKPDAIADAQEVSAQQDTGIAQSAASDPTDVQPGVSPSTFVAMIIGSARQCDHFSNFGDQTVKPDGRKPTYADIMAIHDVCSNASKSIDARQIGSYVSDYDFEMLRKLQEKCGDAYYSRAGALISLANSRYDYKNDQYKPDNPDEIRKRDLSEYQSEVA